MTGLVIVRGATFLADYDHGGPLTGVTVTSVARRTDAAGNVAIPFIVTDAVAGKGQFLAATDAWPLGSYLWEIKTTAAGITAFADERIPFTVIEPL